MDTLTAFKELSVERMDKIKEAVAPKKNQDVLDGLGENEKGNLTYKGKPVGESSSDLPPFYADVSKAEAWFIKQDTGFIIETSLLPSHARVTKIEIPDLANEAGGYIQLEDMVSKDPNGTDCPYYIMYPKDMMGTALTNVAAIVVFTISPNEFYNLVASQAYNSTTIKIYYEIEEN